jgi:transposase-like protein
VIITVGRPKSNLAGQSHGRDSRHAQVDQHGQVIDVLLSVRRDLAAARRFFTRALRAGTVPVEVTTDRAPAYPRVLDELLPSALHTMEQYANNPIEADHGRLKARLADARTETSPLSADPRRGSRLHAEHALRALRHRHRRPRPPPAPHRLRRPGNHHMTSSAFE